MIMLQKYSKIDFEIINNKRMNNDDQTQRLEQLSIQLQKKISKVIIVWGIIFYGVYILVQFAAIFSSLNHLNKSQLTYLNSLGSSLALTRRRGRISFLNFLDSTSKIVKYANFNNNSNTACNRQYYLCDYSNSTNYAPFDDLMKYLRANKGMLKQVGVDGISLINGQSQVWLNLAKMGLLGVQQGNIPFVPSLLNINLSSQPSNSYFYTEVQLNYTTQINAICSNMALPYSNISLCLAFFMQASSLIDQTHNFFIVLDAQTINIKHPGVNSNQLISAISGYLPTLSRSQTLDIYNCLINFPIVLGKYLNSSQALELKCKHENGYLLNMFGPTVLLVSFKESIDLLVSTTKEQGIYRTNKSSDTLFVSSNSTFYENQQKIISKCLITIRQSGYMLLIVLSLCIFVLHFSNRIVEDILLYSVDTITTLGQFLKNKEEKEFNRHLQRGYPEILKFTVAYFHKFMWIHKLRKFKGKYKYKKLLLQGLQIFEEQQYVPVLKFIYIELITIQAALVQKLFKIKELPHKRRQIGSKCEQQQQKIIVPIIANEQRVNKRRNANSNLLDPDDDQLMKNISISFRGNRGVRFSNDIQTIQIDEGPVLRKAKFADKSLVSCETIKNDLSQGDNQSIKRSDYNKESLKSLRSEEESFTSLIELSRSIKKKDSSTKTRSLQSIHVDLDNLKLDEELDDDELLVDQQSEQDQVYNMNRQQITVLIAENYQKVIDYYQRLFDLLAKKLENQGEDQIPQLANYLYVLTIRKYEKIYELLLYQSQNEMEKEDRQLIGFQDFKKLERNYNHYLSNELTQQAQVLRQGILQAQHSPISLSTLQDMYCKSNIKKIRIAARHLLALAAEELQPHLDLVIAKNVYANLKQQKTTSTVKQENLTIFMRNLERYTNFWEELEELKMATQFYNTKNKKFYFLVSISSIKIFTPVLSKFYELLDNFDIFNIYNLEQDTAEGNQNETSQNIIMRTKRRCMSDKLKYLMDLQGFIEQFNNSNQRIKDPHQRGANSVKTIIKKRIYEKQFHQILLTIQNDEVDYSKYVVIFLGDEHNISSSDTEQSSSSANHRPYQQKIHLEITKIIEKGYLHFILVGFSLDQNPSKYGRLKKYVKLSPQLFEVELSTKEQQQNLRRLEKYLR